MIALFTLLISPLSSRIESTARNLDSKFNDDLCFDAELCDQSGAAEPSANEKTAIATSRQLESLGLGQYRIMFFSKSEF
jgi:hypothetical protein